MLQHEGADHAFDQIRALADGIQGNDGDGGKAAETVSQGNADTPDKTAVEQEGDQSLTTAAQGKVGGIGVGVEGHHDSADADEPGGQLLHGFRCIVELGEQAGNRSHEAAEENAGGNGQCQQFSVGIPDLGFRTAGSQHLPHDDADCIAHGQEYHAGQHKQGAGNVLGRHHVQTAGGHETIKIIIFYDITINIIPGVTACKYNLSC